MAQPTCPKCSSTQFTVTQGQLLGRGMVNYDFVHCAQRGAVVHIIDVAMRKKLDDIEALVIAGR